jgi:hypothetical protein
MKEIYKNFKNFDKIRQILEFLHKNIELTQKN